MKRIRKLKKRALQFPPYKKNPEERQTFHYAHWVWDIEKAEQLIQKRRKKDKDITSANVDHIFESIRWSLPEHPVFAGIMIDPNYALTKADISKPLIFGQFKDRKTKQWYSILIDGHHRLYRAKHEGLKEMPAYCLNKRENNAAMLGMHRFPPRRFKRSKKKRHR